VRQLIARSTLVNGPTQPVGVFLRVFRELRRIALWGVLAIMVVVAAALAINAFDERPSREAAELLQPPANPYSPEQNIYLSLAGFDAPAGQSVTVVGQRRIAQYNERVDLMIKDPLLGLEGLTAEDPQRLQFVGAIDFFRQQDPSLWELIRTNGPKIQPLIEQNRELYQRYVALLDTPGYYETARPSVLMPMSFASAPPARKLFLAGVCLGLQSGNDPQTQQALERIRQDIDLWHRVLAGQGGIVSKMVALAYLQTDSLILADMIADPRTSVPADMDTYLPQFNANDWDIGNAFAAEFRVHDFVYRQARAVAVNHWQPPDTSRTGRLWNSLLSPIEGQFYKFNATENLSAQVMNEFAQFPALTPATFAAGQARLTTRLQERTDLASIRTLYNPIGKILVAIAAPAYSNYLLRPYDAGAVQRLVRLSLEIRRQQIVPAAVATFMKRHPEWSTHPADGHTFLWNPSKTEIAIQPVAKQQADRRFSVRIWKQSAG
jgi:hypothetical protein